MALRKEARERCAERDKAIEAARQKPLQTYREALWRIDCFLSHNRTQQVSFRGIYPIARAKARERLGKRCSRVEIYEVHEGELLYRARILRKKRKDQSNEERDCREG